ncbi:MAG: redoxin domain-containing protein [Anaerolineaceae bacterium]
MIKDDMVGKTAAEFSLTDTNGHTVRLSDYRDKKNIVLVFNRGFA